MQGLGTCITRKVWCTRLTRVTQGFLAYVLKCNVFFFTQRCIRSQCEHYTRCERYQVRALPCERYQCLSQDTRTSLKAQPAPPRCARMRYQRRASRRRRSARRGAGSGLSAL